MFRKPCAGHAGRRRDHHRAVGTAQRFEPGREAPDDRIVGRAGSRDGCAYHCLTGAGGYFVAGTDIAEMAPVRAIKEVVMMGQDVPLETALLLERKALQLLFDSADQREGMQAFLESALPRTRGIRRFDVVFFTVVGDD
jgi:hypothetical protein